MYGIAFCPVDYSEDCRALGFAGPSSFPLTRIKHAPQADLTTTSHKDSKTLTAEKRETLLDVMMAHGDKIKWATTVMSPHDLSRGMLRKSPYNLFVPPFRGATLVKTAD